MRREQLPGQTRGRLIEDAVMAVRFAAYQRDAGGQWQQRAEQALTTLTDIERRWVADLEAGRVTGQCCLSELIERRFGPY